MTSIPASETRIAICVCPHSRSYGLSLLLSNNHSTGGTCFGDSGGPNFINDTNVVGGVTSFGLNGNCAGTGGVYRVDRADDLDWLATFLP